MLKNVVSLLLSRFYSKQESELVGHQAMPSHRVQLDATITRYVAPSDGWVGVYANSNPSFDVLVASGGWLWQGVRRLKRAELYTGLVALFLSRRARGLRLLWQITSQSFGLPQLLAPLPNEVGGALC